MNIYSEANNATSKITFKIIITYFNQITEQIHLFMVNYAPLTLSSTLFQQMLKVRRYIIFNFWTIIHFVSFITFSEVNRIDALPQCSTISFCGPFKVIRKPRTFDSNVFEDAAVTVDPLFDVEVTIPVDERFEVALIDHPLNDWKRVLVVRTVAAANKCQIQKQEESQ